MSPCVLTRCHHCSYHVSFCQDDRHLRSLSWRKRGLFGSWFWKVRPWLLDFFLVERWWSTIPHLIARKQNKKSTVKDKMAANGRYCVPLVLFQGLLATHLDFSGHTSWKFHDISEASPQGLRLWQMKLWETHKTLVYSRKTSEWSTVLPVQKRERKAPVSGGPGCPSSPSLREWVALLPQRSHKPDSRPIKMTQYGVTVFNFLLFW